MHTLHNVATEQHFSSPSAAVAAVCSEMDALVVAIGCLSPSFHPIRLKHSGQSSLGSLVSTRHFHHSLQSLEMVMRENPNRSAVPEILRPARLAPTLKSPLAD